MDERDPFSKSGDAGQADMKRRPNVDIVLARPEVRLDLVEAKRLMGLAAGRLDVGDREGHVRAALEGSVAIWRIVEAVRGDLEPDGPSPIERAIYAYIANVAHHELYDGLPQPGEIRFKLAELSAPWPAGRQRGRRPRARQRLIDEVRALPDMPDWRIEDRGRELGVWTADQADSAVSRRRRISRIRKDAAN